MRTTLFPQRRWISALVLLALPAVVQAQFDFAVSNGVATITGYNGPGGVVVIPGTNNSYPVTSIGDYAFFNNTNLTSIIIPNSITNIELAPFDGCANLTNFSVEAGDPAYSSINGVLFDSGQDTLIAYPEGLTNSTYTFPGSISVGEAAFAYCTSLTSLYVTTTSVGEYAFYGCTGLTSVTVTNELEGPLDHASIGIDAEAFAYCTSLTNVSISSTVTSIGEYAFAFCTNMTSAFFWGNAPPDLGNAFYGDPDAVVHYLPGTAGWSPTFGGVPAVGETAQFEFITDAGSLTITGCIGPVGPVVIPESINGYAVTSIGPQAFEDNDRMTSVTVPNSVTYVDSEAFAFCTNLTCAFFQGNAPPNVGNVFYGDPEAVVYYLPGTTGWGATFGGVPTVEETAQFEFEYITNDGSLTITGYVGPVGFVAIPNTINGYPVTSIGSQAFQGSIRVSSVVIPDSVTNVGELAFAFCANLTSAFFSSNATPDVGNAFYGDSSAVVYYEAGTSGWGTTFGGAPTAEQTPATDFYYGANNGSVSISGYRGPGGTVVIPPLIDGYPVTSIGGDAPSGAFPNNVTSVIIPITVTNIGDGAFQQCGLTNIFIPGSITTFGQSAFESCRNLTSVTVANGVTSIGEDMFDDCESLTTVTIPNSVTNIGAWAFYLCVSLNSITIPDSVTSIGINAFYDCFGLTHIVIPDGITSIGEATFSDCTSLTNATVPGSVTSIGMNAFSDCTSLTSIVIPDGVISIGDDAFYQCSSLPSVNIPASVTDFGTGPFEYCTSLTNISVAAANPAYTSTNGILFDKAYDTLIQYPAGLTNSTYTIPNTVTLIGGNAFEGCTSLASVTIHAGVALASSAFQSCTNLTSAYFLGNAPPDDGTVFIGDPAAIIFYLPGTSGWGTTFGGGARTELWNPQATAFTTAGNQFGFNITGPTNLAIVVEACTNLASPVWLPVSTNTLSASGTASFSDPQRTNYPNRYYRFSAP